MCVREGEIEMRRDGKRERKRETVSRKRARETDRKKEGEREGASRTDFPMLSNCELCSILNVLEMLNESCWSSASSGEYQRVCIRVVSACV